MVSASPRPSFLADLLQLGKKTDTSTPVPHPLYCFPSPPDQHSLKGLAGMAVTTDFLCLSFRLEKKRKNMLGIESVLATNGVP